VNCFQKCGFNLNQSSGVEDAAELSIAEDDWGRLKAGALFDEYMSCDNNVVTCEVQTSEQVIGEKFMSEEEEDDADRIEPPAVLLSALESIDIVTRLHF
jgi:hypothetical protein